MAPTTIQVMRVCMARFYGVHITSALQGSFSPPPPFRKRSDGTVATAARSQTLTSKRARPFWLPSRHCGVSVEQLRPELWPSYLTDVAWNVPAKFLSTGQPSRCRE